MVLVWGVTALSVLNTVPDIAAEEAETISDALLQGETSINFRYRVEVVEEAGLAKTQWLQPCAQSLNTKLERLKASPRLSNLTMSSN